MIVLVLDTAHDAAAIALADEAGLRFSSIEPMERGQQERLAPLVRDALGRSGLAPKDVGRVGVVRGPGSFTGVRVGVGFAKGFALGLGVPCLGVSSLEALALSEGEAGLTAAAVDGRRGQVYLQIFHGGRALGPPEALTIADAEDRLSKAGRPLRLTGPGSGLLALPPEAIRSERRRLDLAAVAARLLAARAPFESPAPLYLRAPDARTLAERAPG